MASLSLHKVAAKDFGVDRVRTDETLMTTSPPIIRGVMSVVVTAVGTTLPLSAVAAVALAAIMSGDGPKFVAYCGTAAGDTTKDCEARTKGSMSKAIRWRSLDASEEWRGRKTKGK